MGPRNLANCGRIYRELVAAAPRRPADNLFRRQRNRCRQLRLAPNRSSSSNNNNNGKLARLLMVKRRSFIQIDSQCVGLAFR